MRSHPKNNWAHQEQSIAGRAVEIGGLVALKDTHKFELLHPNLQVQQAQISVYYNRNISTSHLYLDWVKTDVLYGWLFELK